MSRNPRAQIFSIRPSMDPGSPRRAARGRISESARSRAVGARYGISAKTVRDIWNRVTWTAATEPLWTDQVRPSARTAALVPPRARSRACISVSLVLPLLALSAMGWIYRPSCSSRASCC